MTVGLAVRFIAAIVIAVVTWLAVVGMLTTPDTPPPSVTRLLIVLTLGVCAACVHATRHRR